MIYMDTREKILEAALSLFSKKGYHAASIRDICREVGIKESSVYYHFANKRAILDALQARFIQKSEGLMVFMRQASAQIASISKESFLAVGDAYIQQYLLDDFILAFLRILMIEQGDDEALRALYREWFLERPITFQSQLFSLLIEEGVLRAADCRTLAIAYYAPVFYLLQRYLLTPGAGQDDLLRDAQLHFAHFWNTYQERAT